MMLRWIVHVDMDAFYASIEQHDCPKYSGKPVVVGADPQGGQGRGVVAAASYEARTFGVYSAMPIRQAFRRCPQGIFLPVRMWRYRQISKRIFSIFHHYTDLVEPLSSDEAFLDVTRSIRLYGDAESIGCEIQRKIQELEGLSASVGVASNKFVAKIASDLRKPNGFVVVLPGKEAEFLHDLPLERLWGVGKAIASQLRQLGCQTIGDVATCPIHVLRKSLGETGSDLRELARGIDARPVNPEEPVKSIGAETTFDEDTRDEDIIRATLLKLAEDVARRLRRAGVCSQTLTLKHRDESFFTVTRSSSVGDATDQPSSLYQGALALFKRVPQSEKKVRLLGLTASKLFPSSRAGNQLSLFNGPQEKTRKLTSAVDAIQEKFGPSSIARASVSGGGQDRLPPRLKKAEKSS